MGDYNIKSLIIAFVALLICICCLGVYFWGIMLNHDDAAVVKKQETILPQTTDPAETYALVPVTEDGGTCNTFYNYIDGYSLTVSGDMVVDMSRADVYALLSNSTTRLEIYCQPTPDQESKDSYIGYSNGFLTNDTDHQLQVDETCKFGDNYAKVTGWKREKSTSLEVDYNNYVSLDILMNKKVYSIFIKSTEPIDESYYRDLAASFSLRPATKSYKAPKTVAVDISARGWNKETEAFYRKYFLETADLTWGIFEPQFAYFDFSNYKKIEERLDYEFPIMVWYNHISEEPDVDYWRSLLTESYERGKILELTLQTVDLAADEGSMVYGVLDGEYDEYLEAYAQVIADFDHPVLFRLGNEMNGDWCSYSGYQTSKDSLIFKEFYRYVYNIFREAEADNVIWVWNPNGESKPDFTWNHPLMYYPGDEYVDIVGLTAYNTGNYYEEVGEEWRSFKELYHDLYNDYTQWFGQPLMITEFASASAGGDKAAWIEDMFEEIENYTSLKVAIWWDGCDYDDEGNIARSYLIDESEEILDTFYRGLHGDDIN